MYLIDMYSNQRQFTKTNPNCLRHRHVQRYFSTNILHDLDIEAMGDVDSNHNDNNGVINARALAACLRGASLIVGLHSDQVKFI